MKKIASLLLALLMLLSVLSFVGCADKGFDFRTEDLTPYIYNMVELSETNKLHITIADLSDTITDEDVKEEINTLLETKAAYYKKNEEAGTPIGLGDTIEIYYKGVRFDVLKSAGKITTDKSMKDMTPEELATVKAEIAALTAEDIKALTAFSGGSNLDHKSPDTVQLGTGGLISSYETAMADSGAKVGDENVPMLATFPDDYDISPALQGKDVVFFTNIKSVYEKVATHEPLEWGDMLALQYEIVSFAEGVTDDQKKEFSIKEGLIKATIALDQDNRFHAAIYTAFNNLTEGSRFGTETTFDYSETIKLKTEDGEVEVKAQIKMTGFSIANPRYFTADDIGTDALSFDDFCTKAGLKKEDYADGYTTYFSDMKTAMQKDRTAQIKANKYQAVIDALVDASEVKLSSDTMKELKQKYIDEVKGNIEYMTMYAISTGMESYYELLAEQTPGLTEKTVKEYFMYTNYGYTADKFESQLDTDADAFLKERIIFWQFVKNHKIEEKLTDEKYNELLEEYKTYYEIEDPFANGLEEEALREAFIWDITAQYLLDNFAVVDTRPVKK